MALACAVCVPAVAQTTWTPIHDGSGSGPTIDLVHAFVSGNIVVVDVVDPGGQVTRRREPGGAAPVPPDYVGPPPPVGSVYAVSPDGTRFARVEVRPPGTSPSSTARLLANDGRLVASFEISRPAILRVDDDARVAVSLEVALVGGEPSRLRLFDGGGAPIPAPWSPLDLSDPVHALVLAASGARVAVRQPDGVSVFECSAAAADEPDYLLPPCGEVVLSPDGMRAALIDVGRVRFHLGPTPQQVVVTSDPAVRAAVTDQGLGVVCERRRLRVLDAATGALVLDRAPPGGEEYRSLDVRRLPASGGSETRVAVGVLAPPVAGVRQGRMDVVTIGPAGGPTLRSWPTFAMQRVNHRSPTVRFLPDGARVLAWSRDVLQISSQVP